ncbi:uncharacterized protein LOC109081382 isoform X4 [Cyprinus carpio]|uniref:Uncharacterized protein LOC109081382 isoform X4 n=1 Tax=Cyprinus carpio TaxID=7962 RepID=A0A9Q9YSK6_CYPCA|nr:uncharacterized protein LOC109081382 isoform X4 [Cyprinus carpio]
MKGACVLHYRYYKCRSCCSLQEWTVIVAVSDSWTLIKRMISRVGKTCKHWLIKIAYFSLKVIYARRKHSVSPPATTGPPEFERIFRAQLGLICHILALPEQTVLNISQYSSSRFGWLEFSSVKHWQCSSG